MLSYYFSPDFSQSELSREIKDFLLDHDISTWEEGVQSKRLIFIREDHQVLEDFNKEVDLVFKYPAANVGLFESMSDIVFFEISNAPATTPIALSSDSKTPPPFASPITAA